jgi:hypothetical protein
MRLLARTLPSRLAIAALAVPVAHAMPIDGPVQRPAERPAEPIVVQAEPIVHEAEAFDWADAGIGAAGALAIVTVSGGLVARRLTAR